MAIYFGGFMPEFFSKRNYLIILGLIFFGMAILTIHFREGEDGPIHRLQRLVMAVTAPAQMAVSSSLQPVRDGWDYLAHFGDIKRENRRLKTEVGELRRKVGALQSLKSENTRLRKIVKFKDKAEYASVPAHVIGKPSSNWRSSVIIDCGLDDGVDRGMPVVVGGTLVGQVTEVSGRAAKVTLLNDVQSGVSVQVRRTSEVGIVKGQLKNQRLVLQYISRDSSINQGDRVVTSGLGGVFPKGLEVGKVLKVSQSIYSLHKIVEIAVPVNFADLEEVLVIEYKSDFDFGRGSR
ncbi:MAG: rod shape-determining protein MreC [Actinobacteria bacterium]|nr:rod shape-determining protein MreC [Actinomycetota bacterium]